MAFITMSKDIQERYLNRLSSMELLIDVTNDEELTIRVPVASAARMMIY